ncbi:hypothetical protein BC830DRAFT_1116806 [Chytriomyces sp. MP71]|nr:hypothetical protein BC830DRAFT_1116806 [Chytriomyces sp. MP71]
MDPSGIFTIFMLSVSILQLAAQVSFSVLVESSTISMSSRASISTSLPRRRSRTITLSDLRQGVIIVSIIVSYTFEAFYFNKVDFYTVAVQKCTRPIRAFLNAIIKISFLICSYERTSGVLAMVYSDCITRWLGHFVKSSPYVFNVPVIMNILLASGFWPDLSSLFNQLAIITSFATILLASVIDIVCVAAFIRYLSTTETDLAEASPCPVISNCLNNTTTRFRIIAAYGVFSSVFFMGAMGLSASFLAAILEGVSLAMLVCYNFSHAGLFGMRVHSFYMKSWEREDKERRLREVLGNDYCVQRAMVRSADTFHVRTLDKRQDSA